ncbi:hypothetical protein K3495_g11159 [Podosphaera aphanis]|nr:hypothetical protein K3495_g11159 [Podosphaera aphanis]
MTQPSDSNRDTPMVEGGPAPEAPFNLSPQDMSVLLKFLNERGTGVTGQGQVTEGRPPRRDTALPRWNGRPQDFNLYAGRLEIRIQTDLAPFFNDCSICLDMIDTLPEELKPRVASWFDLRRVSGKFNWKEFLEHFKATFSDKQARQTAAELVNRMEQGEHQYFLDFLQDFEHKMVQCGGELTYTPAGKTMQLKASLNGRLQRALIGVKLPSVELFDEWVAEVKEVALELEALADYRPRNSALTVTKFGAPKSGTTQMFPRYPATDGEGDITMGGTNAIVAAIQQLAVASRLSQGEVGGDGQGQDRGGNSETTIGVGEENIELPRAPWRTKEELRRLMREGKCVRCTRKGHFARNCRVF